MNQDIQPNFYSIIPADLKYDNRLKATEKLFFSEISALTNVLGYCYAGNKYFSKLYDCDVRTISRWIQSLEKYGYIKVELIRDEKQVIKERRIYTRESMKGGMDKNVLDNNIYINNITHSTVDEISKIKYADKVYMTEDEYQKLVKEYGEEKSQKCIKELDIYKKSKGVEYADDYSTIKRWVVDRVEEQENQKTVMIAKFHKLNHHCFLIFLFFQLLLHYQINLNQRSPLEIYLLLHICEELYLLLAQKFFLLKHHLCLMEKNHLYMKVDKQTYLYFLIIFLF